MRPDSYRKLTTRVVAVGFLCLLAGCRVRGADGNSFVAIDWVLAPEAMSFPEFPYRIVPGEYVEHHEGVHYGEYIAWDGSYWTVTYTVEVDKGSPGVLLLPGLDGQDAYWTLWLYSFGPSYYRDRSVRHPADISVAVHRPAATCSDCGIPNGQSRCGYEAQTTASVTYVDVMQQGRFSVTVVSTGYRSLHRDTKSNGGTE